MRTKWFSIINAAVDFVLMVIAYILSAFIWLNVIVRQPNMAQSPFLPLIFALVNVLLLAFGGVYENAHLIRGKTRKLIKIWLLCGVGIMGMTAALYWLHLDDFSRGVMFVALFVNGVLLTGKEIVRWSIIRGLRETGTFTKHILVAGTGRLAMQFAADTLRHEEADYQVDGFVGRAVEDIRYLGGFEKMTELLNSPDIDEVVVALDGEELRDVHKVIAMCEQCGTKVSVIPFYNDVIPTKPTVECIGASKLFNLRSNPLDNFGYAAMKRLFDIAVSGILLLLLSPLFLVVAAGIKLSSPGPVFFKQERVGRNKKRFMMYKFRSMKVNNTSDTAWSTRRDSRKTLFGSIIRKFSIDELPQLLNVFRGEMSLIGPRPEVPHYVERFKDSVPLYMVKHQVRPGMTGWAQVNGYRGDTSIVKRIEHDVWYIENWSVRLDLYILLMTAFGGFINNEKIRAGSKNKPEEDVTMLVAAHKHYWMPEDAVYMPLQVGAQGQGALGWQRDDEGEQISGKNPVYHELTGQYWMWKNHQSKFCGLCHYRRYFGKWDIFRGKKQRILDGDDILRLLEKHHVILPHKQRYRQGFGAAKYDRIYQAQAWDVVREVLKKQHPRQLRVYDDVMKRRRGHRFNMFIMSQRLFHQYSRWLFTILFEVEKRLDEQHAPMDARMFSCISERLIDVWLEVNQVKYREVPMVNLEQKPWVRQMASVIAGKLKHMPE